VLREIKNKKQDKNVLDGAGFVRDIGNIYSSEARRADFN